MKKISKEKDDFEKTDYFWQNSPELKKLTILNPEDFKAPDFISPKDMANGGLRDHVEITHRNKIMTLLFDNTDLRKNVYDWVETNNRIGSLPQSENIFLSFYEKENPHWKMVDNIISELEKLSIKELEEKGRSLPPKIVKFLNELKDYRGRLFVPEKEMAKRIKDQLKKTTRMDGIIEFKDFSVTHENSTIIGQKAFQAAWSPDYSAPIAPILKNWRIFSFLKITKLAQKIADYNAKKAAKKSAVIGNFPTSLINDIKSGFWDIINTPKEEDAEEELHHFINSQARFFTFSLKFSYGESGLSIKPIYVYHKSDSRHEINVAFHRYNAWSGKQREKVNKVLKAAEKSYNKTLGLQKGQEVIDFISKNSKLQFGESYKIKSNQTDRDFRWRFLSNIYNSDENVEIYGKLMAERSWLSYRLSELLSLCSKISKFQRVAEEKNIPLCMPKIREIGTGVTFKSLAPINMMKQDKKMYPFSFPSINGRLICLTGRHGRGKSVAGNSVLQAQWMAQSGLPVFAESFEFDIKDVIGAVVNDQGEGSTATVFLQKSKNLLENIQKVPVEKSLIFIDEIGKGTQEKAGMELGVRLLKVISKKGYSAMFNTQIMDLAQFAEKNLNAICLKVDKKHQFSPGIGEGEMDELVKEIGLDKYLS